MRIGKRAIEKPTRTAQRETINTLYLLEFLPRRGLINSKYRRKDNRPPALFGRCWWFIFRPLCSGGFIIDSKRQKDTFKSINGVGVGSQPVKLKPAEVLKRTTRGAVWIPQAPCKPHRKGRDIIPRYRYKWSGQLSHAKIQLLKRYNITEKPKLLKFGLFNEYYNIMVMLYP